MAARRRCLLCATELEAELEEKHEIEVNALFARKLGTRRGIFEAFDARREWSAPGAGSSSLMA